MQILKRLKKRRNNIGKGADIYSVEQTSSLPKIFYKGLLVLIFFYAVFVPSAGYSQELISFQENTAYKGESARDSVRMKSPMGAALRSIIIPGLGQLYNGKEKKALLVAAGEGVLLYSIYNENKKFRDADPEDTARSDYRERRDTLQWWFFFAVGLSAVDAYVDAYLDRFSKGMEISLNSTGRLCLNYNF